MVFMGLTEYANKGFELEQNTRPVILNSAHRHPHQDRVQRRAHPGHGLSGRCGRLGHRALRRTSSSRPARVRRYFMWHVSMKPRSCASWSRPRCAARWHYGCTLLPLGNLLRLLIAIAAGGLTYLVCVVPVGRGARGGMPMLVKKLGIVREIIVLK